MLDIHHGTRDAMLSPLTPTLRSSAPKSINADSIKWCSIGGRGGGWAGKWSTCIVDFGTLTPNLLQEFSIDAEADLIKCDGRRDDDRHA